MSLNLSIASHGAARETTGSLHMLQIDDLRVMLDCGLVQGRRKDTNERNLNFKFTPRQVHSVLLSHAHIDHSGNLPNLVKQGFGGPIYCTPATRDLCQIMLRDSAHIQEKDAEWLNRRNARRKQNRHHDLVKPLYTMDDAEAAMKLFQSIDYHQTFHVLRDLKVAFYDAGHILGSSGIVMSIRRGERVFRLGFSGDIGRVDLPILRDPEIPHDLDWLIMEATYGARTHDPIAEAKEELREVITRVAARGGKIIVPSFSVERTQEIIYYLNELTNEGKLPPIPVYVDSPLAINVTEIYRLHSECFDRQTQELLLNDRDPFGFYRLTYVRDVEASKKLNDLRTPCIIISASGMCEAGRILHHLRNNIEDSKNCIVFVGYQAQGTLGRKIVERQPEVNIFGEPHRLRAEVATLNAFSGHADKNNLFNYARTVKEASKLKKIFLIHGEQDGLTELSGRLRDELKIEVVIPERGEKLLLEE